MAVDSTTDSTGGATGLHYIMTHSMPVAVNSRTDLTVVEPDGTA